MKKHILICLIILLQFGLYAQTIEEKLAFFSKACTESNFENIIKYEEEVLQYYYKVDGINEDYINAIANTVISYYNLGDFKKSIKLSEIRLNKTEKLLGIKSNYYVAGLSFLAANYSALGEIDKAIEIYEKCIDLSKNINDVKSDNYLIYLISLSQLYDYQEKYGKSLYYNLKIVEIKKQVLGEENEEYLSWLNKLALNYSKIDRHKDAIELYIDCLDKREKLLGKENSEYLVSLNNLAFGYSNLGNYEKSLELNKQCFNERVKLLGEKNEETLNSLYNLATDYWDLKEYDKSIELKEQQLKIQGEVLGVSNYEYQLSLMLLAKDYSELGNAKKSIELNLKCIDITKKYLDTNNLRYATILYNIAGDYTKIGEFSTAVLFNLISIEIFKKIGETYNSTYLNALSNLALNYSNLNQNKKSIDLLNEALIITENSIGKENTQYQTYLINLISSYSKIGNFSKSKEICLTLIELLKSANNVQDLMYCYALTYLAENDRELGDYQKAINENLECLKIKTKLFGDSSIEYIVNYNNLSINYFSKGDLKNAIFYIEKCISILEKNSLTNDISYASSTAALSVYLITVGDFQKSIEINNNALKLLKEKNSLYATILNNLALSYLEKGDLNLSLKLSQESKLISFELGQLGEAVYLKTLNNLSLTYNKLGDFQKALESIELYNELVKTKFGELHPDYALGLNNLALLYSEAEEYEKSNELNEKVLKILEEIDLTESKLYITTLGNIAINCTYLGDYKNAIVLNKKNLEKNLKNNGKNSHQYLLALNNIGMTYLSSGEVQKSEEIFKEAIVIVNQIEDKSLLKLVSKNLFFSQLELKKSNEADETILLSYKKAYEDYSKNSIGLSEHLKETSKENINTDFEIFSNYSIFRKEANPSLLANSFNYWLNLNGIISNQSTQLQEQVYASQDTSFIQLYEDWKLNKLQLMKYYELTIPEREEKGINIKEAEETVNKQEQELSRRSDVFSDMKKEYSFSDIQNNLKEDEAFVDVVRLPYYNFNTNKWSDTIRYLAYVITKETKEHPNYVVIENGNLLEEELLPSYSENTFGANKNQKEADITSYNYFWKPISEQINGKKKVFVSMGGVYNNINLQTLYNSTTNKYLLDETDIQIVNNGRSFIQSRTKQVTKYTDFTATLVGYPNYNGTLSTVKENDDIAYSRDLTPVLMDSLARGGYSASPLPATKTEVETIGKTLKDKKWSVNVLTDDNATEDNIKSLNSPRVLHLATHGYFMKEQEVSKENNQRYMGMETQKVVENPLLRSGLLFAGANKTLKGDSTKVSENGILTAYEASYLNLKGTELVVLSACETGKGDIKNGEGVYGLRKSIADAGAKNIIMSLWKVDDKVTQEFMSTFYENWLSGTTIREAFTKTQHYIKDKYPQPYYWGAFVLIGE